MSRRTRSSRPRATSHSAGAVLTACLLALAMFAQAGLSTVHALSHTPATAIRTLPADHDHHDGACHARHQPASHEPHAASPARDEHQHGHHEHDGHDHDLSDCGLCALIAIGKLGWTAPPPTAIVGAVIVVDDQASSPPTRSLRPSLITAAPRGPPIV